VSYVSLFQDFAPVWPFDNIVMARILERIADPLRLFRIATKWLSTGRDVHVIVPSAGALSRQIGKAMGMPSRLDEPRAHDHQPGHPRVYNRVMPRERAPASWQRNVVLGLLAAFLLATRLPAPWRLDAVNDEMFHIKSWRNRYRTADVLPLFSRRIEQTNRLSSSQKDSLRRLYQTSPLFQRLLCVKGDYASVGYSAMAEAIEALSQSNIIALRMPSVLFSLLTIVLAYVLGKTLWDEALGLWIAAFFAVGVLQQVYAGVGRPHGMTQFALVALVTMFVRERRYQFHSPWRMLLVALFGQTAHLTGWSVFGILVASELVRRYLAGASLGTLVRQTWWYAAASVLILGLFMFASFGTSVIGANVYYPGVDVWWTNLCVASPFGHLAAFGKAWEWGSGIAWVVLILNGLRILFTEEWGRGFRWPFLIALVVCLSVPFVASSGVRHLMIYGVIPMVLSGIGARGLFRGSIAALAGVAVLLVVFTPISLACGDECRYGLIMTSEVRYSQVANLLAKEMEPGDIWISWPYFLGCPLYPYRELPEPVMPITRDEFKEALHKRPADHSYFVLLVRVDEKADPALEHPAWRIEYPNGMVLLKLAPKPPAK
jgi:hypothetical protein